jgi:hypothetical protein
VDENGSLMEIIGLELNCYLISTNWTNQQKLLISAVKNCDGIPFHRTFLGFHLLMGLFPDQKIVPEKSW